MLHIGNEELDISLLRSKSSRMRACQLSKHERVRSVSTCCARLSHLFLRKPLLGDIVCLPQTQLEV